jgi:hypothetical protein
MTHLVVDSNKFLSQFFFTMEGMGLVSELKIAHHHCGI